MVDRADCPVGARRRLWRRRTWRGRSGCLIIGRRFHPIALMGCWLPSTAAGLPFGPCYTVNRMDRQIEGQRAILTGGADGVQDGECRTT